MFFPEKEKSYREAYRVLAPGGRYVFSVWDGDYQPVGRIADEVAARFFPTDPPQFYRVCHQVTHRRVGGARVLLGTCVAGNYYPDLSPAGE
jgi:hypothetical protein